jgi:xanthine dehydrogenase/oxidase
MDGLPVTSSGDNATGAACPLTVHHSTEETIKSQPSLQEEMSQRYLSEPIFPPALMHRFDKPLLICHGGVTWYQPSDLPSLLLFKASHPQARIVVGNTEVGIETKFKGMEYSHIINPSSVPELKAMVREEGGVRIGAAATLQDVQAFFAALRAAHPEEASKFKGLLAMEHMLKWFASNHIRNMASIGGNVCTASPISDMIPMLCASNAVFRTTYLSQGEIAHREVLARDFFKGYRRVDMAPDAILQDIFIPFTSTYEFVVPLKQAKRREDDISIVTAGVRFKLAPQGDGGWVIEDCAAAYGGMAPTVVCPSAVERLRGLDWTEENIRRAAHELFPELALPETVPGGQAAYRMSLASSFLLRSYLKISEDLAALSSHHDITIKPPLVPSDEASGAQGFVTQPKVASRGEQEYFQRQGGMYNSKHQPVGDPSTVRAPVGEPLSHRSSELQATGEARYVDDIPNPAGTLYAAVVTSTRAHAKIKNVNTAKCRQSPGFVAYFDHRDVRGSNHIGAIHHDEEVFVTSEVKHFGAVIALVVAHSHEEAVRAAKLVDVEYEDLPAVISIEDAIHANSFFGEPLELSDGNVAERAEESDLIVSGTMHVGGQEHFYLETNMHLAVPSENGVLEMFCSAQNADETQHLCAKVCNLPASKVSVRIKRIGGGFGGKESRTVIFTTPVALAANALGVPVRINVDRDVDMQLTGQRHAFLCKYRAGCTDDGTLKFLDAQLYSNCGFSYDLSEPVLGRALFHIDNVYKWPAFRAVGRMCRTNQSSHTAFRGFGAPQGMSMVETVIEHMAKELQKKHKIPHGSVDSSHPLSPFALRRKNMYTNGNATPFGTVLEEFNVPEAWDMAIQKSDFFNRERQVREFNANNKWTKRGIFLLPTKYGINYTAKFMNQGGALINIYKDGTVLVSHGGVEMGQGIHTKMTQVVARALGTSPDLIYISESATNVVPNAIPSAGSMTTDLYGMALLDACEQLNARLEPLRQASPNSTWKDLVLNAFFHRVDLSAHGFYKVPDNRCGYDWYKKNCSNNAERGHPFNYFTQGVTCAEVEIDCLTGDSRIVRADIVMDVGQSLNPAIDIGQIEGAFVQGFGWCTMEELIWGDAAHKWVRPGQLFTRGPGTYKIPSFNDVPGDMRVYLMDKSNTRAVHSSKGIGEPPFFMACSAFFAIRNAIAEVRSGAGYSDYFLLNMPATSERIRMACPDEFSKAAVGGEEKYLQFQPQGSW